MTRKRPAICTFLALGDFIIGLILVSLAIGFYPLVQWLSSFNAEIATYFVWISTFGAIILAILGIVSLVVGYGLWIGKGWAYWLTLFGYGLGVATIFTGGSSTIVSVVMIAFLVRRDTQRYCKVNLGFGWGK